MAVAQPEERAQSFPPEAIEEAVDVSSFLPSPPVLEIASDGLASGPSTISLSDSNVSSPTDDSASAIQTPVSMSKASSACISISSGMKRPFDVLQEGLPSPSTPCHTPTGVSLGAVSPLKSRRIVVPTKAIDDVAMVGLSKPEKLH